MTGPISAHTHYPELMNMTPPNFLRDVLCFELTDGITTPEMLDLMAHLRIQKADDERWMMAFDWFLRLSTARQKKFLRSARRLAIDKGFINPEKPAFPANPVLGSQTPDGTYPIFVRGEVAGYIWNAAASTEIPAWVSWVDSNTLFATPEEAFYHWEANRTHI